MTKSAGNDSRTRNPTSTSSPPSPPSHSHTAVDSRAGTHTHTHPNRKLPPDKEPCWRRYQEGEEEEGFSVWRLCPGAHTFTSEAAGEEEKRQESVVVSCASKINESKLRKLDGLIAGRAIRDPPDASARSPSRR